MWYSNVPTYTQSPGAKKPAEAEYKDIVQALTIHYNPNPSQIAERFKFNSRVRRDGESIAAFVADLR
jgi:hypothetical protein